MRKVVLAAVLSFGMASASTAAPAAVSDLPVLPMPARFKARNDRFSFVRARTGAV